MVGVKGSMVICELGVVVMLGVEYRVRLEELMGSDETEQSLPHVQVIFADCACLA